MREFFASLRMTGANGFSFLPWVHWRRAMNGEPGIVAREQEAVFLSYKLQAIQLRAGTQGWLMRMVLPRLVPKTPQA